MRSIVAEGIESRLEFIIANKGLLGSGRGSDVQLVELREKDTPLNEILVAEKRYELRGAKSLLTKLIYNVAFQAPFAYAQNYDAIRAAFYRRKVVKILLDYWRIDNPNIPKISDALYTRWDDGMQHFCLGTEFVDGRGALPSEMDSLVGIMDKLNEKFLDIGFIGPAWQVESASKYTGVATQNLLYKDGGWCIVDLESGIVPPNIKYLKEGRKNKSLLVFDDINFNEFSKYIQIELGSIEKKLGKEKAIELCEYLTPLFEHTQAWKQSETALFRHGFSNLFGKEVRHAYVQRKVRSHLITKSKGENIGRSVLSYIGHSVFSLMGDGLLTYAKRHLAKGIYEWEDKELLTHEKADELIKSINDPAIKGYMQDIGFQMFTAALTPPGITEGLALAFGAFALSTGNNELFFPASALYFGSSILRSFYSSIKFIFDNKRRVSHAVAATSPLFKIALPFVPGVGHIPSYLTQVLLFPTSEDSMNNVRKLGLYYDIVSPIGKNFPFYGGEGTRLWNTLLEKTGYHTWVNPD